MHRSLPQSIQELMSKVKELQEENLTNVTELCTMVSDIVLLFN